MLSLREIDDLYAKVERSEDDMHEYQETAVEFLFQNPFSALFIDTGLGKTVIVLTLIMRLLLRFSFRKALVVAPIRVANQTWPNEIPIWQHTACLNWQVIRAEDDDAEVISAGKAAAEAARPAAQRVYDDLIELGDDPKDAAKYRAKIVNRAAGKAKVAKKEELRQLRRRSRATVHIIDREHLEWLVDQHSTWKVRKVRDKEGRIVEKKFRDKIIAWPYDVVALDESSAFKDHSTARFKAMQAVRLKAGIQRLHMLTATPAAESYLGLFAQMYLLDLGQRLGRSITAYKERYFTENTYNRTLKINPGAQEEISANIADICLVMRSGDYLEEEDPLFLPRRLRMEPEVMQQYRRLERDFVLELSDGEIIEAVTAADLSGKLLQLASGSIYSKTGQARPFHNEKIEDLAQLREELQGEPLLVSYWYKSSLARLKAAFPEAKVMDKAGKLVGPWNEGKIDMMFIQPAGSAHGLNMQYGPGHDLYGFDLPWSFELFYQLYRRLARQGQKKRVRVHMPRMIGTHDERLADALALKEDGQEVLFKRITELRRAFARKGVAA